MDYFSNKDKDVFIINLPKMIDRGALMSRYSRAAEVDLRRLWEKEFSKDENKGERFYELIFLEYGDESISELVTAQVGIQNVSNILSKIIEEGRIGLSYLEKSSRYVSYDEKINGKYLYADPEKIGIPQNLTPDYIEYCDEAFDDYIRMKNELIVKLKELYPIEGAEFKNPDGKKIELGKDNETDKILLKSYENSIRSRALDEARSLLPSSTLTNIGISGNARAFSHLLERLKSTDSVEASWLYNELYNELTQIFPKLINSVESLHGVSNIKYLEKIKKFVPRDFEFERGEGENVSLLSYRDDDEVLSTVLASYYFERADGHFSLIKKKMNDLSRKERMDMIKSISDLRSNRRQKPDRSLEHVNYTFEITLNFGAFRELQRHRILSIQRKMLTTEYGYDTPPTIAMDDYLNNIYRTGMERARKLFKNLKPINPFTAQYVVPFGYRYPVIITINLREIIYLVELRSTPQAHYDLRRMSWEISDKIIKVNPSVESFFKFVNRDKEELGRLTAEVRKETKRSSLINKN